jgi:hypothetical protein
VGQDRRDHGLQVIGLPRRVAALAVVPPIGVPTVTSFRHNHNRTLMVERVIQSRFGPRGVVAAKSVEQNDRGIALVRAVARRQKHVRPWRT